MPASKKHHPARHYYFIMTLPDRLILELNSIAKESWGSMQYSQGLSNNTYYEQNLRNSSYWYVFIPKIYLNTALPSMPSFLEVFYL